MMISGELQLILLLLAMLDLEIVLVPLMNELLADGLVLFGNNVYQNTSFMVTPYPNAKAGAEDNVLLGILGKPRMTATLGTLLAWDLAVPCLMLVMP